MSVQLLRVRARICGVQTPRCCMQVLHAFRAFRGFFCAVFAELIAISVLNGELCKWRQKEPLGGCLGRVQVAFKLQRCCGCAFLLLPQILSLRALVRIVVTAQALQRPLLARRDFFVYNLMGVLETVLLLLIPYSLAAIR